MNSTNTAEPVAWIVKLANGFEEVWQVDPSILPWNPEFDDCPSSVTPLYSHPPKSDRLMAAGEELRKNAERYVFFRDKWIVPLEGTTAQEIDKRTDEAIAATREAAIKEMKS